MLQMQAWAIHTHRGGLTRRPAELFYRTLYTLVEYRASLGPITFNYSVVIQSLISISFACAFPTLLGLRV